MSEPVTQARRSAGPGSTRTPSRSRRSRQALATGAVTAQDLTAFYLSRIERLNPVLHAVISVSAHAVADAKASDEARARGAAPRPLEGIPVLVKDNIAADGMPTTAGSPALAEAEHDEAFCVQKLRDAGAVILGKANLSEWANFRSTHSTSGWSTLGGQAANPHALDRNPSGSSSGSAVAVAAGLAPVAVGTETDGSIVCPASACGIVGIKPTRGPGQPQRDRARLAGPGHRGADDPLGSGRSRAAHRARRARPGRPGHRSQRPAAPATTRRFWTPSALAGARLGVWRDGSEEAGAATAAVLDRRWRGCARPGAQLIDPIELPGAAELTEPELAALTCEFRHDLNAYLAGLRGPHPDTLADLIKFNINNAPTVLSHFGQELFEHAEATGGDLAESGYLAARSAAQGTAREALDGPFAAHQLDAIVTLTANPGLADRLRPRRSRRIPHLRAARGSRVSGD